MNFFFFQTTQYIFMDMILFWVKPINYTDAGTQMYRSGQLHI